MSDTTTPYAPLTLTRDRTGQKFGTLVHGGYTYQVKVQSNDSGSRIYISVVNRTGDLAESVYMRAGMLIKHGIGQYRVHSANAEGHLRASNDSDRGYVHYGTVAACAERVVYGFLEARAYAKQEAAKTPEEKATEAQALKETQTRHKRQRIEKAARDLLALLDTSVPDNVVHYAVEGTRSSLDTLVRNLDSVKMTEES